MKLIFILLSTILVLASAYKWKVEDIPNPFTKPPAFCGLKEKPNTAICDPESLLLDNRFFLDLLVEKQNYLAGFGNCACPGDCESGKSGLHFGFLIIGEYANDNSNEPNPNTLNEFSDEIRKNWNLGYCDNSILITIATGPKQYGYSLGKNAGNSLNETFIQGIILEAFRNRKVFNVQHQIKEIFNMFEQAMKEEMLAAQRTGLTSQSVRLISDANTTFLTILIVCLLIVVVVIISIILFVVLKHRKENDDISIRDVWTKKFWLKAGNQYKEAKQSESGNEKDIEKNDEDVKAKLASTEDLKPVDDIENVDIEYPGKFSKV